MDGKMTKRLNADDARTLDLYLSQHAAARSGARGGDGNGGDSSVNVTSLPRNVRQRLHAVGRIMDLLSAWPAPEPSGDLAKRTLQLIDNSPAVVHHPLVDRPNALHQPPLL
jgi:hypothetical protein